MPYITSIEQIGIEKGLQQGLQQAIEVGLELKFGEEGLTLLDHIRPIADVAHLRAILDTIREAATLDEVRVRVAALPDTLREPPQPTGHAND
jgi:hypothetical protein